MKIEPKNLIALLLLSLLLLLSWLSVQEYQYLHTRDAIGSYHNIVKNFNTHKVMSIIDIKSIRIWMTFRYINSIFNLPPSYLKDKLKISNPKYPDVSLGTYSKSQKINPNILLDSVKKLISDYLSNNKTIK